MTTRAACDELAASWEAAVHVRAPVVRRIDIAGLVVRFEAAGPDVLDLLWPALGHHPAITVDGRCDDDLTLRIWDLAATGAPRPALPEGMIEPDTGLLHPLIIDDGTHVRFEPAAQSLVAWAPEAATAWCCIDSLDAVPWWEQAAPLRSVLSWCLEANDRQLIHGAAVGDESGAVILAGPGGSGKSTTALACHLAGMGFLGDDYCAVSRQPHPWVHSLYSTAKLRLDDHDRTGPLAGHLLRNDPGPDEKAVALVAGLPGTRMVESAPVRAVAAVRIGAGDRTRLIRASKAAVLAALAPSSILQLPGVGEPTFSGLARLVRSVPVAVLELGRDRDEIIAVVSGLAAGKLAS